MKRYLNILSFLFLIYFLTQNLYAQTSWKHYYGYPHKTWAYDIAETYDKGYMIGGLIQRQNFHRTGWVEKLISMAIRCTGLL